ncbi:MAG: hypothetical protein EOP50_00120 [Sphingobacteriales bacterium]|nr:MAG: hypothetical protein EOP50_00120 [Sphingobacteriales bacterium]
MDHKKYTVIIQPENIRSIIGEEKTDLLVEIIDELLTAGHSLELIYREQSHPPAAPSPGTAH